MEITDKQSWGVAPEWDEVAPLVRGFGREVRVAWRGASVYHAIKTGNDGPQIARLGRTRGGRPGLKSRADTERHRSGRIRVPQRPSRSKPGVSTPGGLWQRQRITATQ